MLYSRIDPKDLSRELLHLDAQQQGTLQNYDQHMDRWCTELGINPLAEERAQGDPRSKIRSDVCHVSGDIVCTVMIGGMMKVMNGSFNRQQRLSDSTASARCLTKHMSKGSKPDGAFGGPGAP